MRVSLAAASAGTEDTSCVFPPFDGSNRMTGSYPAAAKYGNIFSTEIRVLACGCVTRETSTNPTRVRARLELVLMISPAAARSRETPLCQAPPFGNDSKLDAKLAHR